MGDPTLREYIDPIIDRLKETKSYVESIDFQLIDSKKPELTATYPATINKFETLINKEDIEELVKVLCAFRPEIRNYTVSYTHLTLPTILLV